jgi:nicotinate-nucleotide pyrophosphorylase (carboxylating)
MRLGWKHPEPVGWTDVAQHALKEDLGTGDISGVMLDPDQTSRWYIEAQAEGVVCGVGLAAYLMTDPERPDAPMKVHVVDGERVSPGERIIEGYTRSCHLLSRERVCLNFLMMLSGTASLTRRFVDAVAGTKAQIVDTRKTIPGLRGLQKYAVRCGGGRNHRMGLYDGLLIKDNHIRIVGSITRAVAQAKAGLGHMVQLEIECETLGQVAEALGAGAHVVMVDNMPPDQIREAVKMVKARAIVEASGGVTLETVRAIAEAGVDMISVGALTHSAPSLALHLEIE